MRRVLFIVGSVCWLFFAAGIALLLADYLTGGAGLQFAGWNFSLASIFIGWVHVVGLALAAGCCVVIGAGFWIHGFDSPDTQKKMKS